MLPLRGSFLPMRAGSQGFNLSPERRLSGAVKLSLKPQEIQLHKYIKLDNIGYCQFYHEYRSTLTWGGGVSINSGFYVGPSGVCALPLAAGINVGGHYKWHFFSFFLPSFFLFPAHC